MLRKIAAILLMFCVLCSVALADYTESEMSDEEYLAYLEREESIFKYQYDNFYYNYNEDGTIRITYYFGDQENVILPSEIDGCAITVIGEEAFAACYNLETITIPESITVIESKAFGSGYYSCYNLSRVNFPDTPLCICDQAFCGCDSLTDFVIPDTVSIKGNNPFAYILNQDFHLSVSPSHPTLAIIDGVLFDQESRTLICYPQNLENSEYTIPEGTVAIAGSAFEGNQYIQTINICSTLTSIGPSAFRQCFSLEDMNQSYSILFIGESAFEECVNLKHFDFPHGLHIIPAHCFLGCNRFVEIQIPDHVAAICDGAFMGCQNLNKVYLPQSVQYIGEYAFSLTEWKDPNVTLVVSKDSFAQQFAIENEINFECDFIPCDDFIVQYLSDYQYSFG